MPAKNSGASRNENGLSPKQQRFVDEYLVDLNGTQAAIRAGYSKKTAEVQAVRLLGYVKVSAAVQKALDARSKRTEITADKVLTELAKIAFANMADYMKSNTDGYPYLDFSLLTRDQAAALQEVTVDDYTDGRGEDARQVKRVKFKLADKRAALVDIGKHLGMFAERYVEVNPDGSPKGERLDPRLLGEAIAFALRRGIEAPTIDVTPRDIEG